jgi:hypothetical protein
MKIISIKGIITGFCMLMIFTKQFFGCADDIITSFKGERIFYVGCVKRQKKSPE